MWCACVHLSHTHHVCGYAVWDLSTNGKKSSMRRFYDTCPSRNTTTDEIFPISHRITHFESSPFLSLSLSLSLANNRRCLLLKLFMFNVDQNHFHFSFVPFVLSWRCRAAEKKSIALDFFRFSLYFVTQTHTHNTHSENL